MRQDSSSDDEETVTATGNDSMDIDNLDCKFDFRNLICCNNFSYSMFIIAWTSDAIPVANDAGNPWESQSSSTEQEEDNWANFSKADFDSAGSATPMEVSDSPSSFGNHRYPFFDRNLFCTCFIRSRRSAV